MGSRLQKTEKQAHSTWLADAQINYFSVLCRELANELIYRNPDRFVGLTEQIVMEVGQIQKLSKENAFVRLNNMMQTYTTYGDFDVIGTKNYNLYTEGFKDIEDIEIEKYYHDIQIWCALNAVYKDTWKFNITSDCIPTEKRLEEVQKYISLYKDTILVNQIKSAKRHYDWFLTNAHQLGEENSIYPEFYNNADFEIRFIHHAGPQGEMGLAWSVKMLATEVIGCWSIFHDDGESSISYFAADTDSPRKWRPINVTLHGSL